MSVDGVPDADLVDSDPRSIVFCRCDAAVVMTSISYHVALGTPSGTNSSGIPEVMTAKLGLDAFFVKFSGLDKDS